MVVAVIIEFEGTTLEDYDAINGELGLSPGGPMPASGLFHWVCATDSGIRVTDVWQSSESFQKFAAGRLMPAAQRAGVPEPRVTFTDVHNYLTAG
ncbi:hypothetical protein [Nocardia niigatensis]